jgi:two-component system sensor histidine kinase KdpD
VSSSVVSRVYNHDFLTLAPNEDFMINVDSQLLCQALVNVLDNAFRHTRNDCDVVLKAQEKDKKVVFQIDDNGGGIDPDKIDYIFDSFYSIEQNMGIGLSVCKYIVEEHGGTINVYNNHNGGTTVKIVLPIE